ncbi:MAG: phosphoenolpyruvate carboxykinase [Anaerolineae bacterium]|jgi:phosphoenolpyruvate carboxykinase (ATP)|nr:phosphoenolpyruvate carboxykinase [Anaerolineae bacterium]
MTAQLSLESQGITTQKTIFWNLTAAALYEESLKRQEGQIVQGGALAVRTGQHTGRSPKDKYIVREPISADRIAWGDVNRPMEQEKFEHLKRRMLAFAGEKELFVQDAFAGADPRYRLPIRVITRFAWHSLFARHLFIPAERPHTPEFTVIDLPDFQAIPEVDGTRSEVFIVVSFAEKLVLIGGTEYAGEIKKSIFTVLNYLLPLQGVFPMHCSANIGQADDTAIFFGLSGTGKTTLSADPKRTLIGDDEHGWSDRGVFNFEGGCYAKVINLSPIAEPEIYQTTRMFSTVLENVVFDPSTRKLNLADGSLTENTRAAYPIAFIPNAKEDGLGQHPRNVIMLTADAFGVLPPVAKLTPEQAMYHFLSGYTAKVAGTEKGVTEPQATFSACFGAPFLPLHPTVYADLLREKITQHQADVWLVNTGWSGGAYGVGSRMKIAYTRAIISAVLDGSLSQATFENEPFFGLAIPAECPGVPSEILNPRTTWADQNAYDAQAQKLANMFSENAKKFADRLATAVTR